MNNSMTIIGVILIIIGLFGTIITFGFGIFCTGPLMLIGFILLIAGLITPEQETTVVHQPPQYPLSYQANRYCPSCGRAIPFDALICPYCSKDFSKTEFKPTVHYCSKCGIQFRDNDAYCHNCGKKIKNNI